MIRTRVSQRVEQLEFKFEKNIGITTMQKKLENGFLEWQWCLVIYQLDEILKVVKVSY